MRAVIKKYLWLWEFIGVGLILGVGLLIFFMNQILFVIVGLIFAVLGILRIVTLVKTTKDKLLKWLYAGEIFINIAAGVTLIVLGLKDNIDNFKALFGYIIGALLYIRGVIYFFASIIRKEGTDISKFIAHLIFITFGTFIIAKGGFEVSLLGWIILVIAVLAAIFVSVSGVGHYRNYRNEFAASEITKTVKTEESLEAPTADEIIPPQEDKEEKRDEIQA